MAKKNSSKTATEKAIQSSEPRVITFKGWQGVNFVDAPLTWNPLEDFDIDPRNFRQTDLPANFFMVQNNLNTTDTLGVETRMDSIVVGKLGVEGVQVYVQNPDHNWAWELEPSAESLKWRFTGVTLVYKHWIFCAVRKPFHNSLYEPNRHEGFEEKIFFRSLLDDDSEQDLKTWHAIQLVNYEPTIDDSLTTVYSPIEHEITDIAVFEGNLVVFVENRMVKPNLLPLSAIYEVTEKDLVNEGSLYLGKIEVVGDNEDFSVTADNMLDTSVSMKSCVSETPKICPTTNAPTHAPTFAVIGMQQSASYTEACPVRIEMCYCYTNRLGSTLVSGPSVIYTELSPRFFTPDKYIKLIVNGETQDVYSITGVDFYFRENDNRDWAFAGHASATMTQVTSDPDFPDQGVNYNWYGAMTDISQWATAQLLIPSENSTHGPDAAYVNYHDSRMYCWGMYSKPYRLWIGGNPGAEFSVARGLGGAWVDIEPGSGYDIKGTAKWKTTSGSNIVTIMCGNQNTTKIKRFNLVETNLTLTNEVAYKSYMYEEVSNVVGCNSRWGYGVYDEGLYALNRYGLMLTTMAAEYNNQMKNQKVSDVIEPVFTDVLGKQLRDGRMVFINGIIYIVFSEEDNQAHMGNVIFCYDTTLKAWYTWTHDETLNDGWDLWDLDNILHVFAIDSDEYREGVGAITEKQVRLYPVTGEQDISVPEFQVLLESGELAPRLPTQAYWYLQQMEFRFDYFIGDPEDPATVLVEGVDYYGRYFQIEKKLNYKQRTWQSYNDNGAIAHHKVLPDGPEWTTPIEQRNHTEWIRIDKLVQSVRIRIKGHARFRLTHINAKVYQQADTIGTPWGLDARDRGYGARGKPFKIHHYIDDYNNLRRAVVS